MAEAGSIQIPLCILFWSRVPLKTRPRISCFLFFSPRLDSNESLLACFFFTCFYVVFLVVIAIIIIIIIILVEFCKVS